MRSGKVEYVACGLCENPPCGCKGKRFLALDRIGLQHYLTCLHCDATWGVHDAGMTVRVSAGVTP